MVREIGGPERNREGTLCAVPKPRAEGEVLLAMTQQLPVTFFVQSLSVAGAVSKVLQTPGGRWPSLPAMGAGSAPSTRGDTDESLDSHGVGVKSQNRMRSGPIRNKLPVREDSFPDHPHLALCDGSGLSLNHRAA